MAVYLEEGRESLKQFVEDKFGIHYRKAMYLIGIHNELVESGVSWDKVKHLGWTKLKEIAHLMTPENVDEWVTVAEKYTTLQLQEHIKALEAPQSEGSEGSEAATSTEVTTVTFNIHKDQKEIIRDALGKAKKEFGTEVDPVALENLCMSFLNTEAAPGKATNLEMVMKQSTWQDVLDTFRRVWPDIDLTVSMSE